jgi:hypothetical protein
MIHEAGSTSTTPPANSLADNTIRLQLHGGHVLAFSPADIPAPPALRLAEDINLLIQWWDDSSDKWAPDTVPFQIKGYPVALKYWIGIYKRDQRWVTIKNQWHLWKVRLLQYLHIMLTRL